VVPVAQRERNEHTTMSQQLFGSVFLLLVLSFFFYSGGSWKLSQLFRGIFEEDDSVVPDYVLPRQDMLKEYGREEYKRIVAEALGLNAEEVSMTSSYGVDVSYPTHRKKLVENPDFEDKTSFYENQIQGCHDMYKKKSLHYECDQSEDIRLEMNLKQPRIMQNYTDLGYKKLKAPKKVMDVLTVFWEANQNRQSMEVWTAGSTYTNHWTSPTSMVSVDDPNLNGGGMALRNRVWMETLRIISDWVGGLSLQPVSMYGVRVYKEGSILAPHVDRLPLVASAIINVAQDVDEAWPIEIHGHDGIARNITMEPGDMLLYESHSVIHGRPFPLKGRYYANLFIHFEPNDHTKKHADRMKGNVDKAGKLYRKAMQTEGKDRNVCKASDGLCQESKNKSPNYITPGSEKEARWNQKIQYDDGNDETKESLLPTSAHYAAKRGDLITLKMIAETNEKELFSLDQNGWAPLHEAARSGHVKIIIFLLEKGADINERTNNGSGGTPLFWALNQYGENHAAVKALKERGAISIGSDMK
jgi:prolyl 4-hydroxylase